MVADDGQTGVDPVLFAFGVIANILVTKLLQLTGGVLRSVSGGIGAVHHNLGPLVWQKARRQLGYLIGRKIFCTRQMCMMISSGWKGLNQLKIISPVDFFFQLLARNRACHAFLIPWLGSSTL